MKTLLAAAFLLVASTAHAVVGAMNYNADSDGDSPPFWLAAIVVAVIYFVLWSKEKR